MKRLVFVAAFAALAVLLYRRLVRREEPGSAGATVEEASFQRVA